MTNYNMLLVTPWTSMTENPKYIPRNHIWYGIASVNSALLPAQTF